MFMQWQAVELTVRAPCRLATNPRTWRPCRWGVL